MFCSHKCKLQTRRVDLKYAVFLYTDTLPLGVSTWQCAYLSQMQVVEPLTHILTTMKQQFRMLALYQKVRYKYRFICKTTNNLSIFDVQVFFLHPRHIILNITIYNSEDMSFKKSNHLKYIPSLELGFKKCAHQKHPNHICMARSI